MDEFDFILRLIIVCVVCITAIIITSIAVVYGFEMTKELREETRILDLCMNLDAEIANCWDLIGSIDKTYGEPQH
jgi:hypothetical protein